MIGDLDVSEALIVRGGSAPTPSASPTVIAGKPGNGCGRVVHKYGRFVEITQGGSAARASTVAASNRVPADFRQPPTETEQIGRAAFALRISPAFREAKDERVRVQCGWGFRRRDASPSHVRYAAPGGPKRGPEAPTSDRMSGRVAVCAILVSGPGSDLHISNDETIEIAAQVQHGLSWLASLSNENPLTWLYDFRRIEIELPASATSVDDFETMERPWRDAALRKMGEKPGHEGIRTYGRRMRRHLKADRVYVAFFTKYPLAHFAYAFVGGPHLVMDTTAGEWGLANLDRVFAHETCHIFGAADEYAESGCDCGGRWGVDGISNANCENCNPTPEPCIMRRNEAAMCEHTWRQIGLGGMARSSPGIV